MTFVPTTAEKGCPDLCDCIAKYINSNEAAKCTHYTQKFNPAIPAIPDNLTIRKKEVNEAMKANISIPVQEIAYLPL